MRQRLLMIWYILLMLFLLQLLAYGVTGYLATGYRTLVWGKFNKEVHTVHDVDKKLPYAESINRYARDVQINPQVIVSVIQVESSFKPRALSSAGAYGLMQIMPATWRQVNKDSKVCEGRHPGECTSECYYNGDFNIHIGTNYLSQLLKKYQGNMILALAAYNAGPGIVDQHGGVPPYEETENYIESVITNWYQLENKNKPYFTVLLIKQWERAHKVIGWCIIMTLSLIVWTVWWLVKWQSSWCWR